MRAIVTNIPPEPTAVFGERDKWWLICTTCAPNEYQTGDLLTIEAETQQQAFDYALSHWRLSHLNEVLTLTTEVQLTLELVPERTTR